MIGIERICQQTGHQICLQALLALQRAHSTMITITAASCQNNCEYDALSISPTLIPLMVCPSSIAVCSCSQANMQNTNQLGVKKKIHTKSKEDEEEGDEDEAESQSQGKQTSWHILTYACVRPSSCCSAAQLVRGSPWRRLLNGYHWNAINANLIYSNLILFQFVHVRVFYSTNYVPTRLGRGQRLAKWSWAESWLFIAKVRMIYSKLKTWTKSLFADCTRAFIARQ